MRGTSSRSLAPDRRVRAVFMAAALLAGVVAMVVSAQPASAAPSKSRTVLFVHGYNPTSTSDDCGGDFDTMISQMRSEGFTGTMLKVGWYSGDYNCNLNLHSYGSYGDRDSWKEIAKAFSSYVYNTYTRYGVAVDVVGYSMGGLITRGAVYGSQIAASGFSPPIDAPDIATLGTPHQGAAWYSNLCLWGQCASMAPGSTDLNWLNQNGNPQGSTGTTWTNFGSYNDDVVPYDSATSMSIPVARRLVYRNVSHTGVCCHPNYMHAWSVVNRVSSGLGTVPSKIGSGVSSTKCVDDSGAGTSNGNKIQIWDCNGGVAQTFTRNPSGTNVITVQGKCLDISGSNTANGTKVQLYECNDTSAQQWTINTTDHTIRGLGKCLDDAGSNVTNGTQIQLWDCNGTAAQRWY